MIQWHVLAIENYKKEKSDLDVTFGMISLDLIKNDLLNRRKMRYYING